MSDMTLSASDVNVQGPRMAETLKVLASRSGWTDMDLVAVLTGALVAMGTDMGGDFRTVEYFRDIADDYERQIMQRG